MKRADGALGAREAAEARARELAAILRDSSFGETSDDAHELGRRRLADALREESSRRTRTRFGGVRGGWGWVGGLAIAALALLSFARVTLFRDVDSNRYAVIGPEGVTSSTLEAPVDAPLDTEFADGSKLRLAPATRVHITTSRAESGRIVLERGTVEFEGRDGAPEIAEIFVGPFRVEVLGAALAASLRPAEPRVEVKVTRGKVRVHSSETGSAAVRAGQRFVADVARATHAVEDTSARPVPVDRAASARLGEALRAAGDGGEARGETVEIEARGRDGRGAALPSQGLGGLLAAGDFRGVVAAARAFGIERCLSACGSQDLRALADAARYTGERDLAERALLALEGRHSSSTVASFLLGRHFEASSPARSLEWYATYLKRAPRGTYAAEALAGKMRALESLGRRGEARDVARIYLSSFPDGVHAAGARRLVDGAPK